VDQFIQPGADRPQGGDLLDLGLFAGCGDEFVRLAVGRGGEILECGEFLDRGDADPPQSLLLGPGHVREQREVFGLGAPLHAELVVQAAVALERQAVRDLLERGLGHLPGDGVLAQHEVVGRPGVGVRVGHNLQQRVRQAEDGLGRIPQRPDLVLFLRRGVGGRAEQDAGLDRGVGDAAVGE
jgi:hypothetical protein